MMYLTTTGPTAGEPIVMLHGAMVAGWMWTQQAADLDEFRCLVPDLPGFDHSGDQPWTSLPDVADQVADLIGTHTRDGTAHIVGLSLGGLVALHLAARHQDLVRTVLVSGVPAGRFSRMQRAGNSVLGWLYGRPRGAGVVSRALGLPDEESRTAFVSGARRSDPDALRRIAAELAPGALPDLSGFVGPLMAVVGDRDSALPRAFVRDLHKFAPSGTAVIVPGVGHQWNAQRPDLFAALVRSWVNGQPLPKGALPA